MKGVDVKMKQIVKMPDKHISIVTAIIPIFLSCSSSKSRVDQSQMRQYSVLAKSMIALPKPPDLKALIYEEENSTCNAIQNHIKAYHEYYLKSQEFNLKMVDHSCVTSDHISYITQFSFVKDKEYPFQLELIKQAGIEEATTKKYRYYGIYLRSLSPSGKLKLLSHQNLTTNSNLDRLQSTFSKWFGDKRIYSNPYSCSLLGRKYVAGDHCEFPAPRDLSHSYQAKQNLLVEEQVIPYIRNFSRNFLQPRARIDIIKVNNSNKKYTMIYHRLSSNNKQITFNLVLYYDFIKGTYYINDNLGNTVKAQGNVKTLTSYKLYNIEKKGNQYQANHAWSAENQMTNILHPNFVHYQKSLEAFLGRLKVNPKNNQLSQAAPRRVAKSTLTSQEPSE